MPYSTGMVLSYRAQIVQAIPAANYSGAAGTGTYISLKNTGHVSIIIQTGAWAGGTSAVTVNQATAVAGTSAKALAFSWVYTDAASVGNGLVQTAVTSNTFTLGVANATYVIEIDAAQLDLLNNFDCLNVVGATPGSNADYYSATYVLASPEHFSGINFPLATTD